MTRCAAMGLPEGRHKLGDMDVEVVGIKCTIAGTNTLAGAAVDHVTCIKNFRVCAPWLTWCMCWGDRFSVLVRCAWPIFMRCCAGAAI